MEQVRRKSKKEERKEKKREKEREPFGRRDEAVETPPTRFLCGPQLCCFFGPRNETLPANNPTRVLIFADDPALTGEETSWPSPSPRKRNTTSTATDFRLLQILSLQRTFLIHFIGSSILAQAWKSHWARLRHAIRLGRYYRRLNFAARRGALNAHAFYGFRSYARNNHQRVFFTINLIVVVVSCRWDWRYKWEILVVNLPIGKRLEGIFMRQWCGMKFWRNLKEIGMFKERKNGEAWNEY